MISCVVSFLVDMDKRRAVRGSCQVEKLRPSLFSSRIRRGLLRLHGSYEVPKRQSVADALVDLTGGLAEEIRLDDEEAPRGLARRIARALDKDSIALAVIWQVKT